jgi:hypothetical protein
VATYTYIFDDGSPALETSDLNDAQDAVSFSKIVAAEIGHQKGSQPPGVTIHSRDGKVEGKDQPLTCSRCASEQALSGVERHGDELCFTFTCTACKLLETRSVCDLHSQ